MTNNISKKTNTISSVLYMAMLSIVCLAVFVVTLVAFVKIDSNVHAFLILATGCIMTAIIFISGKGQYKV